MRRGEIRKGIEALALLDILDEARRDGTCPSSPGVDVPLSGPCRLDDDPLPLPVPLPTSLF